MQRYARNSAGSRSSAIHSPAEITKAIEADWKKYADVVKKAKISLDSSEEKRESR
jgi:hypothetical protein